MDFRTISLDRVSFDDAGQRHRSLRYGGEKAIRVQTPRFCAMVSSHSWGKRLSMKSCTLNDEFASFLKHVESIGGGDWVDETAHPLEHVYVSEETLVFDELGQHIDDGGERLSTGATLLVSCIVAMDGLILTRDVRDNIVSARLSVRLEQVKIHATTAAPMKPAVYVNGVILRDGQHERIADARAGE